MKIRTYLRPMLCALTVSTGAVCAQEPSDALKQANDLDAIRQQLLEIQSQHRQEIDALKAQIAHQQKLIEDLQKLAGSPPALPPGSGAAELPSPPGAAPASSAPLFPTTDPAVVATAGPAAPGTSSLPPQTAGAAASVFPTEDPLATAPVSASPGAATSPAGAIPILTSGRNYLNLSLDGIFVAAFSTERQLDRLEVGDHDPQQRGFNARNVELAFDGAVDPYFEAFANIVFKLDDQNETEVEVEEAFMLTTTLPWGLQFKGGQFFAPFGRINAQHPHVWDFVDAPLVSGRLLGPDGLRGAGAQISWALPVSWYSQLSLAVQNGEGGTGFSFRNRGEDGVFFGRETLDRPLRGVQDLLFVPRWEASLDLSATQTLLFGVSGAFGPNDTGPSSRTRIYGVDAFYKWKPANAAGGWPFVKWQTEAMYRRFEAGRGAGNAFPVSETLNDWGAYSQVVWGFAERWTAGLRGDYLHVQDSPFIDDPDRVSRWRASLNLTWQPTEFSKLRLQYNHDFLEDSGALGRRQVDSVFFQFEFSLGAHAAHKF